MFNFTLFYPMPSLSYLPTYSPIPNVAANHGKTVYEHPQKTMAINSLHTLNMYGHTK